MLTALSRVHERQRLLQPLRGSTVAGNVVWADVLFFNLMRNEQPPMSLHPLSALSLGTLIFNSVS